MKGGGEDSGGGEGDSGDTTGVGVGTPAGVGVGTGVGAGPDGVGVAGGDGTAADAAAAAEAPDGSELGSCRPLSRTNVVGVPPLMVPFVAVCPNVSTNWHCASWHQRHTLMVSPMIGIYR